MWNVPDFMVYRLWYECFFRARSNTSPLICSPFWVKTTFPTLKTVGAPFFSVIRRLTLIISRNSFSGPDDLDAIPAPQAAHAPLPNAHPEVLQLFSHAWSPVALQA